MHKLRSQLFLLFTVVALISLIISSGITVLLSADAMTQELQKGEGEMITLAKKLLSESAMTKDAMAGTLSSYSMYRLDACEEEIEFKPAQRRALDSGASVSRGWQANTRTYFLLEGECWVVTAKSRNIFAVRNTLEGYLNVTCTVVILYTFLYILGKRLAKPMLEMTEATRSIAGGDLTARVRTRLRRENAATTQLDQLVNDFNQMASELERIEYLRRDFTSNVSHEVKTPISTISGYAQLLESDTLPAEDRREYARLIREECAHLSRLSENLLRITRIESRKQSPAAQAYSLDEQLRRIAAAMLPRIRAAGLSFSATLPGARVRSDGALLEQVWINLLDNAIKFTPPGGEIRLSLQTEGAEAIVCVADTGIGIAKDAQARIFEMFYQADDSHRTRGNGLGLALCRRIVDALGGRITVSSAPGEGSRFTVSLPARKDEA